MVSFDVQATAVAGTNIQVSIPAGVNAEASGYNVGQQVDYTVPYGVVIGQTFTVTLPSTAVPMYDTPKAPPPGVVYDVPTKPPPAQRMADATAANAVAMERQEVLQKYRDAADPRGKDMKGKCLDMLQYEQLEVNIEGNDIEQEKVFEGMLPGETLVKTLDCFIRHKRRTRFQLICYSVLTLCFYPLWLLLSALCCRSKKCGNTKVTLGITSFGRLVYWHTDTHAAKRTFPPTEEYDSQTYRRYFKMNDVNMVQFKFQKRFDMIDENDFDDQDFSSRPQGHLRLFMGAFPVVTHSAADWVTTPARKLDVGPVSMSMGSSERWQPPEDCFVKYGEMVLRLYDLVIFIHDLIIMIRGIFEFSLLNIVKFMFLAFRNVLNAYRLALYGEVDPLDSAVTQERCIDVYIHDDDEYAKTSTNGVYDKMMAFQKDLLMMRNLKTSLTCDPVKEPHWHFVKGESTDLLKRVDQQTGQGRGVAGVGEMGTSSVGIHEDEVPLMDGEHVIDAYGEVTRWKDLDVLKTMVTFGFYYLFYLRREFVKHKAVIVTNRRVIQITKAGKLNNKLPVYNDIVYDMDLKWWSLEGVYAGLVREQMLTMQAQMACKNGVIGIELNQMRTSVFHTYVMKKQVRHRFHTLLFSFSGAKCNAKIKNLARYGLSLDDPRIAELPKDMLPLMPIKGEKVIGNFQNEHQKQGNFCGTCTPYITMGWKPITLDGSITVSTHRYLVESHPHFDPWCMGSYTVTGEYLWLWGTLDNDKNMQGWSMQGTVKDHSIYCEWLSKMCYPSRVKQAKYSLVDFTMLAHNATAVQLQMKYRANPRGRMDEPKVQLMRQVMIAVGSDVADDVETGLGGKAGGASMEFNTGVGMGGMGDDVNDFM